MYIPPLSLNLALSLSVCLLVAPVDGYVQMTFKSRLITPATSLTHSPAHWENGRPAKPNLRQTAAWKMHERETTITVIYDLKSC